VDPVSGDETTLLTASGEVRSSPVVSPDGAQVGYVQDARLWVAPVRGEPAAVGDEEAVTAFFGWSADGQWLAYGTDDTLRVRSTSGGAPMIIDVRLVVSAAWSPAGSRLAFTALAAGERTTLTVFDAETGQIDVNFSIGGVVETRWSPSGNEVTLTSPWLGVRLYDVESGATEDITADPWLWAMLRARCDSGLP
jgi:Tol biopolymer transport system component